jgi:hypothetical protein
MTGVTAAAVAAAIQTQEKQQQEQEVVLQPRLVHAAAIGSMGAIARHGLQHS